MVCHPLDEPLTDLPPAAGGPRPDGPGAPLVSVLVPIKDEGPNIRPLVGEIVAALDGRHPFEIVYVDDGSSDDGAVILAELARAEPRLRFVRHRQGCGQSAALRTAAQAATGRILATLDGDGQNDPADLPRLIDRLLQADPGLGMAAGWRQERRDTRSKRLASRYANAIRGKLLGDQVPDTGCGLKAISRDLFLNLPYFDHMHRFLPALVQREGLRVEMVPVHHRPRAAGTSKYGNLDRALVGIVDLVGVAWLMRRRKLPEIIEP